MFSGGDGTRENPFLVSTKEDFFEINNLEIFTDENKYYYEQTTDIDLEGESIGTHRYFRSVYDGKNYKIINVVLDKDSDATFGRLLTGAEVRNVRIVNLTGSEGQLAAIASYASESVIENCHVENGELLGGGYNDAGIAGSIDEQTTVLNCSYQGYLEGVAMGGIVYLNKGTVEGCVFQGIFNKIKSSAQGAGGIVGLNAGTVRRCKSIMEFRKAFSGWGDAGFVCDGGIAGTASTGGTSVIEECDAQLTIANDATGQGWGVGGILGFSSANTTIKNCSSTFSATVRLGHDDDCKLGGIMGATGMGVPAGGNITIENCIVRGRIDVAVPANWDPSGMLRIGGIIADMAGQGSVNIVNCYSALSSVALDNETSQEFELIGRIWGANGYSYGGNYPSTSVNIISECYAYKGMTLDGSTEFPDEDKALGGKDGEDVSASSLKRMSTYTATGWDFSKIWALNTKYNDSFPYLRGFGLVTDTEDDNFIRIYSDELELLAVVAKVISPTLHEDLAGGHTFDFDYFIDDGKSKFMQVGNIVEANNNYYRICYTEETRESDDTLGISVSCEQMIYDLIEFEKEFFTADGTLTSMANELLQGTAFTLGNVGSSEVKTVSIQQEMNKLNLIYALSQVFGCEVEVDKFTIHFLEKRGKDKGFQFCYRRNIRGIKRIVDNRNKVDGLPSVAYDIDAVMLEQLFGEHEKFGLGDIVRVCDEGLGIDIETRIVSMEYDIEEKIAANVQIANFIPNVADSIIEVERSTVHKEKVYNGIRIGPEKGIEIVRSDKMARNTMNATYGNILEVGDGEGNYEPVFYITIENGEGKLNLKGNAEVTGKIISSVIIGGSVDIGDGKFTVDSDGNVAAMEAYINGIIESSEFIGGKITIENDSKTERAVLSKDDGFRFQSWDADAEEWRDSIWLQDGRGMFVGEIMGSIITGGIFRTAESGERVEISDNQIRSCNASGKLHGLVTNSESGMSFGDWFFYDDGTIVLTFLNALSQQGVNIGPANGATLFLGTHGHATRLFGDVGFSVEKLGFFGATTKEKQEVDELQPGATAQEVADKLQELIDALKKYGLI